MRHVRSLSRAILSFFCFLSSLLGTPAWSEKLTKPNVYVYSRIGGFFAPMERTAPPPRIHPLVRWVRRYPGRSFLLACVLVLLLVFSGPHLAFSVTHFPPLHCGAVSEVMGRETSDPKAGQIAACFLQVHQQCHAADISLHTQWVDTSEDASLSTANGIGGCVLTLTTFQSGRCVLSLGCALGLGSLFPERKQCRDAVVEQDALHLLGCGSPSDNDTVLFSWTP